MRPLLLAAAAVSVLAVAAAQPLSLCVALVPVAARHASHATDVADATDAAHATDHATEAAHATDHATDAARATDHATDADRAQLQTGAPTQAPTPTQAPKPDQPWEPFCRPNHARNEAHPDRKTGGLPYDTRDMGNLYNRFDAARAGGSCEDHQSRWEELVKQEYEVVRAKTSGAKDPNWPSWALNIFHRMAPFGHVLMQKFKQAVSVSVRVKREDADADEGERQQ